MSAPTPTISLDTFRIYLHKIETFAILPEAIEALDTLFVYLTNLITSPHEVKYHTISAVNIHFHERLGHLTFSEPLLTSIGYQKATQPIPHYRFNIELLKDTPTTQITVSQLSEALSLVERLRTELNVKYKELPHMPAVDVELKSVIAAGRFADRGRRATMEDQEALIDSFYPQMAEDLARLYAEYLIVNAKGSEVNVSREELVNNLLQIMPNYSNLAFFAVYDGHGGTETAEFAVKFLHQSIRQEMVQFLAEKLKLEFPNQPQIKQQQQFLHITDQFLTQLPTIDQIQDIATDCVRSTDFSGKAAYLYYEDLISNYLQTALSTSPLSPITPSLVPNFQHPTVTVQTPGTREFLSHSATQLGHIVQPYLSTASTTTPTNDNQSQTLTTSTLATNFAELVPTRLLTRALFQAHVRTDNQLRRCLALHSGCTTVTSIVGEFAGQRFVITGNCGDSRAILSTQSTQCCHYASLPRDQKPHIYLRHLGSDNTAIVASTQFAAQGGVDAHMAGLPLPTERVKSLPNSVFYPGDVTIPVPVNRTIAQRLSLDHKPQIPNETNRIVNLGGFVSNNGRTMGVLAVSRALGDHGLKNNQHYVSSRPHIDLTLLSDPDDCNQTQNPFLLLACDGVWDVVKDQEAVLYISGIVANSTLAWLQHNNVQICAVSKSTQKDQMTKDAQTTTSDDSERSVEVYNFLDQGKVAGGECNKICATCVQRFVPKKMLNIAMTIASQRLVELALLNGSTDNVTAMAIRL